MTAATLERPKRVAKPKQAPALPNGSTYADARSLPSGTTEDQHALDDEISHLDRGADVAGWTTAEHRAIASNGALLPNDWRFEPYPQLCEAIAAISAVRVSQPIHAVILRLMKSAQPVLEAAEEDSGQIQNAADRLGEILTLIDTVEEGLDDVLVYAAGTLVTLAKVQIDVQTEGGASDSTARQAADSTANPSNFDAGRVLAIQMLTAGDALDNTDQAEPYRWMRGGAAQNRFVLPFLQRLVAEPELMDGFAAVLSGRLGTGEYNGADYFNLPETEYQPGLVGADGTATEPGAKASNRALA